MSYFGRGTNDIPLPAEIDRARRKKERQEEVWHSMAQHGAAHISAYQRRAGQRTKRSESGGERRLFEDMICAGGFPDDAEEIRKITAEAQWY
jgi:hypothetical protein